MNADWLQRLQRGAGLLFWSLLAAYLLPNVFGFLVPLLGGVHGDLRWASLIYTLAVVPALIGVFALASRCPPRGLRQPFSEALRMACGILVTLELLRSISRTVSRFLVAHDYASEWQDFLELVGVLAAVAVLIRMGQLARSLGAAQLGRSFFSVTCVYVALVLTGWLISVSSLEQEGGRAYVFCWTMWLMLHPALWIWSLVLIGRFRRRVGLIMAGNCGNCEYDLTGNESGVCPECGTTVVKA